MDNWDNEPGAFQWGETFEEHLNNGNAWVKMAAGGRGADGDGQHDSRSVSQPNLK
jgi:hypothetical protein